MHEMERTPRIITIIGLVLEGFAVIVIGLSAFVFKLIESIPGYTESLQEMTAEELESYEFFMNLTMGVLIGLAIIIFIMFMINIVLFTKLINGKLTEEQARKVYLYQAIWGGISVLSNTLTGILYLVSGVQGYSGQKDRIDTREGI